jgi:hypothetical protein
LRNSQDSTIRQRVGAGGIGDQVTVGMVVDDFEAALEQFREIANDLDGEKLNLQRVNITFF